MMGGDPLLVAWMAMAFVAGTVVASVFTELGVVTGQIGWWLVCIAGAIAALVLWSLIIHGSIRIYRRIDTA